MPQQRLNSLDVVRGVAALVVAIYHWTHLKEFGAMPWASLLAPAYQYGWIAVDLFFVLSGFVFFWRYRQEVATGDISAGRFAWLRIARLYPLHLATLLLVLALQSVIARNGAGPFQYPTTDFWFHVGMLQGFVPHSYNGPSWSISIEMVLYGLFFLFARAGLGWKLAACLAVLGLFIPIDNLSRGVAGFFAGGVTFYAWNVLKDRSRWLRFAPVVGALAIVGGLLVVGSREIALAGVQLLLFPTIVLALTAIPMGGLLGRFGDLSYALYMIHFPIQLLLVLAARQFGFNPLPFLPLYLLVVVLLSVVVHYGFEKPAMDLMRSWMPRRPKAPLAVAPVAIESPPPSPE